MRILQNTKIDFMGTRKTWYSISGLIIFAGIVGIFTRGVTFGIDFLGGSEVLVRFENAPEISEVRNAIQNAGFKSSEIKSFGSPFDILILTPDEGEGTKALDAIQENLRKQFPNNPFELLKAD